MAKTVLYQSVARVIDFGAGAAPEDVTLDKWNVDTNTPQSNHNKKRRVAGVMIAAIATTIFVTNLPTETLTDNFNDNSIDSVKWSASHAEVVETNEQIEISLASGESDYKQLSSKSRYDLTNSYTLAQLVDAGNQSRASFEAILYVSKDNSNKYYISVSNGATQVRKIIGGVNSQVSTTAYSSANHKWFRIRESGGTIYFEYSANGFEGWTELTNVSPEFSVTDVDQAVQAGAWDTDAGASTAKWDNFNLAPENITHDKWFPQQPAICFDKPRNQYLYPAQMPIDTYQLTQAEDVATFKKWSVQAPDIIFDKKRNQHLYPERQTIVPPNAIGATVCTTYHPPTSTVSNSGVVDPDNAWVSDDARAVFDSIIDVAEYGSFGDFGIPAGATIKGIQARVEASTVGDAGLNIGRLNAYSTSGGGYGSNQDESLDFASDTVVDFGADNDLWGTTWTPSDFADGTFKLKVSLALKQGTSVDIDYIEVSVCYANTTWEEPTLVTKWFALTSNMPNPRRVTAKPHIYSDIIWHNETPPPPPEEVNADKWLTAYPDINFDKKRNQYLYPWLFDDATQLASAEAVSPDRFVPQQPDYIWDIKRAQYMYPSHFPSSDADFEEGAIDRFQGYEPDYIFDKPRNQYLYPSLFIDDYWLTQPEETLSSKWSHFTPDIVFDKKRQQYTYPYYWANIEPIPTTNAEMSAAVYQTELPMQLYKRKKMQWVYPEYFTDPSHVGDAETITIDKWLRLTPDIVFDKKRNQYLYPTWVSTTEPNITPPEDITADKWIGQYPDIIFDKKRIQHAYPYNWDEALHLLDAERVDYVKWYPQYPDFIHDIKRQAHTYPFIFIDFNEVQTLDPKDPAKWMPMRPDINFDKLRLQFVYPYLAYYDGLIIVPCPPHTPWGEGVTPASTDFTQQTANNTDWSKSDPNGTDWTGATAPNGTDWSKADPNGTDWDGRC